MTALEVRTSTSEAASAHQTKPLAIVIVSHGWTIRNYLLTDFVTALARDCRVAICSPLAGDSEFEALCARHGASVYPLLSSPKGWLQRRVAVRRTLYHFAWVRSESMAIKKARATSWHGPLHNWRNRCDYAIAGALATPTLLRWFDKLDARFRAGSPIAAEYRRLFDAIKPAVVFCTAPIIEAEWLPLYVAQRAGIATAAAVLSWDNLTSKGRLPYGCDRYVFWTPAMAAEGRDFHPDIAPHAVAVTGTSQFDFHRDPSLRWTRDEFCRRLGLDPARKIVVYAGVTESLMPQEPQLVSEIAEAFRLRRLSGRPQLLLRPHPADAGTRYRHWREKYPDVPIYLPGEKAAGDVRKLVTSRADLEMLVNTLVHGDIHLNIASTMTLDAALLDRPVVNIQFDARTTTGRTAPGLQVYGCSHYGPVLRSGGVRVARSIDELLAHVEAYLADPSRDAEGRRRMVEAICGHTDGSAAARVAGVIGELAREQVRA